MKKIYVSSSAVIHVRGRHFSDLAPKLPSPMARMWMSSNGAFPRHLLELQMNSRVKGSAKGAEHPSYQKDKS